MNPTSTLDRKGLLLGVGAYVIWGVLPLYIHLLRTVPALQLLAHRVVWSLLLLAGIVLLAGRLKPMLKAARGRTLLYLCASTVLIGINWLTYIYAVQHSHVLEASLGYFINPLLNVALGMVVLGERLRRVQGVAVGIASLGVLIMAMSGGALWVSLVLAGTFALYGLIRKVAAIDALGGLTMETLLLAPLSLLWLLHVGGTGEGVWGVSVSLNVMLVLAGILTALPLLMFSAAARRMPYSTLGLVQYISPTLSFLLAVLVLGEPLHLANLLPFALIWIGCALYCWDLIKASRDAGAGI
jgi:chloramphenicol-sensitive protein RarD